MATPQFRNLVFEGGGVKGIAYVGALELLAERGWLDHIERVGGTSAGAINALLHALGFDLEQQHAILDSTDFRDFMDSQFGVIRDLRRLARHFGWYRGDFFSSWLGELIARQLGHPKATFAELAAHRGIALSVIGTNLSTGYAEVFSAERHADLPVLEAIRISMSIPLFFAAVRHGPRGDVYVDGGVQMNYPVKLFDRLRFIAPGEGCAARHTDYYARANGRFINPSLAEREPEHSPYVYNCQTLGLRLDSAEQISLYRDRPEQRPLQGGRQVRRFTHFARALVSALMKVQENQHLHSDDWQRTLYINTLDVGTTEFDLSAERKAALIEQGRLGAERYLQWFMGEAVAAGGAEPAVNRLDVGLDEEVG